MKIQTKILLSTLLIMSGTLYSCSLSHEVPIEQLLGDISGPSTQFSINIRHSPPYQILLGVPTEQKQSDALPEFEGEITISNETKEVVRFPVSDATSTASNWLQDHGDIHGIIVTWNNEMRDNPIGSYIKKGQDYTIEVIFNKMPPPGSSLWISSMTKKPPNKAL